MNEEKIQKIQAMKKRVCVIQGVSHPDVRVMREVKSLIAANYEVHIICWNRKNEMKGNIIDPAGMHIYPVGEAIPKNSSIFSKLRMFKNLRKDIVKKIIELNPDIIHCNDLEMMSICSFNKRTLQAPIIFDIRENWPHLYLVTRLKPSTKDKIVTSVFQILEKWCCKKANHIIVVVNESKNRLTELGIQKEKITVVMNLEKVKEFVPLPCTSFQINIQGNPIITYTGGFGPHRGLETAIKAIPSLRKKYPEIKLLLVGDGNNTQILKDLIKELKVEKEVILTGWQPAESLPNYIEISDVCVIPHLSNPHTDSTIPNKLFQYMLMKKPVVSTNLPPLERIVNETKCGITFPSGDYAQLAKAIETLAENKELVQEMGNNGEA
ncbi:MAG: glycosyltransferase family 4 protein, partial [Thermoplasmata archaeon]|nr:glycosyltransferase family 4 protein [Thermoplasmata archaeon]